MVYKSGQIFLPFCHNPRVWKTDRWTDGQTDGRTDRNLLTIPRLHYMQRGKNDGEISLKCCETRDTIYQSSPTAVRLSITKTTVIYSLEQHELHTLTAVSRSFQPSTLCRMAKQELSCCWDGHAMLHMPLSAGTCSVSGYCHAQQIAACSTRWVCRMQNFTGWLITSRTIT